MAGQRNFRARLKNWRTKSGKTQGSLEREVGAATGYFSKLEAGHIEKPPDFVLCTKLDAALDLEPGTAWRHAAPERLLAIDPHLHAHYQQEADPSELTTAERSLIELLREFDDRFVVDADPLAEQLEEVLLPLSAELDTDHEVEGVRPSVVVGDLLEALTVLGAVPIETELRIYRVFIETLRLATPPPPTRGQP